MAKLKNSNNINHDWFGIFNSLVEPVLVTDSSAKILFANKSSVKKFNYSSKTLLNSDISKLLPGFNKNTLIKAKKPGNIEFNGRSKNGKTLFLELSLSIFEHGGKKFNVLLLHDISKRKKIIEEQSSPKQEAEDVTTQPRMIPADSLPIAFARLDADTDKFNFVNEEFTRQSGYGIEVFNLLSRREIYEMVHPDDRDALYAAFKVWINGGYKGTLHHEYRIINKHKNIVWLEAYFYSEFDSSGKLVTVNQLYIDITERKIAEEKLQILGHAIESTTEMITITDLNNRFTFLNRAFEKKYGYSESELIGKEVEIIGSVKNLPEIHEVVFKDTKKGGWEGELVNTKKDGTEFPILLSTSQIKNKQGEVMGYIGVARDITELKNAYDRLRHSLTEKEILLKEVYHRIKNNMQVISSLLNIQSQSVTEPTAIELFRETQNRVRIMQLIHEKLYKSQDLSKIDFSLYIRDLTDQLRRAYPVSKNIELTINSEGIFLGVDRAIPCGLIINELISNAYKYAFTDGQKGNIYIELTVQEDKLCLIVSDNGIGIPETIDFRESDSLGMILVSTLSDQLEGTVEIDRTAGTKFTIRF